MTYLTLILFFILVALIAYILLKYRREKKTPHSPYLDGLLALIDNNIDLAIKKLKEAAQNDTDNIEAYIRLGDLFRQKNEINRAIQIHQPLTVRPTLTKELEKKIYLSLARDYIADKRYNRAVSFLKEILNIDRDNHTAREMILQIFETTENFFDAAQIEEEFAKKSKNYARLAAYYAEHGRRILTENEKEGINYLRKALKLFADCPNGLYYLGEYYVNQGKLDKAADYWERLLEIAPVYSFLILGKLEKVYFDLGRFDDLIPRYRSLFNKNPKNVSIGLALSEIYLKKDEYGEARDLLAKITDVNPQLITPHLKQLALLIEENNCPDALALLNRITNDMLAPKLYCKQCGSEYSGFTLFCKKCPGLPEFGVRYF
ncbi:MAG: tetratricopeptide repeat protein [candidate division WOR-3 bacterium]